MSEEENGDMIRTVTAPYRSRSDGEMNILAIVFGLGLAVILIPLLPFFALVWLIGVLSDLFATDE